MKISFLTSGHDPFDDRIFYHMAGSLSDHGHNVEIISSRGTLDEITDNIRFDCFAGGELSKRDKINQFADRLNEFKPSVIICSEPLTIIAAKQYSKRVSGKIRIIYDITEWYPSKKNLSAFKIPVLWFVFIKLVFFNLFASWFADSFIFGEWYKSRPYRFLYPGKSFVFISYYPALKYISFCAPELGKGKLRLCYSGKISLEKGFGNFSAVVKRLADFYNLKIDVKIIGWYESASDRKDCEDFFRAPYRNVNFTLLERQSFNNFTKIINDTDIFLDLRAADFENRYCLPIKLFYYAALGRPVIFSDLKAIRKEVEIEKFGFLVNPENTKQIASLISEYLNNRELYYDHCANARSLAEKSYNWQKIEPPFLKFLTC